MEVVNQIIDVKGGIIFDVVSKKAHSTCHKCGKPATKRFGTSPVRLIRHVSIVDTPVYLRSIPFAIYMTLN